MLTLVIARHGETEHNAARRLQGQTDTALTATGREQARVLGGRLAPLRRRPEARIVCSDTGRAVRTAQIALPGVEIQHDERLREMHFGRFEGLDHAECMRDHADAYRTWIADPLHARVPDGESFPLLQARVLTWLDEQPRSGTTVAVTHGGPGCVLLMHFLGIPFAAAWRAGLDHGDAIQFTVPVHGTPDVIWLSDDPESAAERSRRRIEAALAGGEEA